MRELYKFEPYVTPWPRMILCSAAATIPLLVGLAFGNLGFSIYGALTGYLLALNDHLGTLKHRLLVTTLTYALIFGGFALGLLLRGHIVEFTLCLTAIVFWLGILGGTGAELERGVLFSAIGTIIVFFANRFTPQAASMMFSYSIFGFATMLAGMPLLALVKRHRPEPFQSLKESVRRSFDWRREAVIYAAVYTSITLLAVGLALYFEIERGYWIAITVLLVMRADRFQSLNRTLQRLLGTAIGVLFCDLLLQFTLQPLLLIFLVAACGLFLPWALKRNYLTASVLVTVFIVSLLELAAPVHGDIRMPFVRLQATLYACLLSLAGTYLAHWLARLRDGNCSTRSEAAP